jgi:hypothetical protein
MQDIYNNLVAYFGIYLTARRDVRDTDLIGFSSRPSPSS